MLVFKVFTTASRKLRVNCLLPACLASQLEYIKDGSARAVVRDATLR